MDEIDKLLKELREIEENKKQILNTRETWEKIGKRDFIGAGFENEEEVIKWIEENDYVNL